MKNIKTKQTCQLHEYHLETQSPSHHLLFPLKLEHTERKCVLIMKTIKESWNEEKLKSRVSNL